MGCPSVSVAKLPPLRNRLGLTFVELFRRNMHLSLSIYIRRTCSTPRTSPSRTTAPSDAATRPSPWAWRWRPCSTVPGEAVSNTVVSTYLNNITWKFCDMFSHRSNMQYHCNKTWHMFKCISQRPPWVDQPLRIAGGAAVDVRARRRRSGGPDVLILSLSLSLCI